MPQFSVKFLARPAAGRPATWQELYVEALNTYGAVRLAVAQFLTTRGRTELMPTVERMFQLRVDHSNTPRLTRYDGSPPVTHAQLAGHGGAWFEDRDYLRRESGGSAARRPLGQGLDYHEALLDAWDQLVADLVPDSDRHALRALLGSAEIVTYKGRRIGASFLQGKPNYNATCRIRPNYDKNGWPLKHRWQGSVLLGDGTNPRWSGWVEAITEEQATKLLLNQAARHQRLSSDVRDLARVEFQSSTCPLARSYDRAYRDSYLAAYRLTPEQLELQRARWDSLARARGPKNGDQPSPAQPAGAGDDDEPGSL